MSNISLGAKGITTLKCARIPDVIKNGYFMCSKNYLTSLEFGPKEVSGDYYCSGNKLTSLEFCASKIGVSLYVGNNLITNLKDVHKQFNNGYIGAYLNLQNNNIESHVLGVILIPKLQEISIENNDVRKIINKHLKSERDVLECQEELIQNDFKEFAKL